MKQVVIVMGPPGAGKGTQAELITDKLGLIHFDTGRYLETLFREGRMPFKMHREFERGDLVNPVWTLKVLKKQIEKIATAGFGILLSGSPRTVFEAFGGGRDKGVIETLVRLFGRKNIIIFNLDIPPQITMLRNSRRKVCSICWKPHLMGPSLKSCPFCGGKLMRRTQDKPSIIKNRLKEYEARSKPVLLGLKARGFRIIKIDGRPKAAIVFSRINRHLK